MEAMLLRNDSNFAFAFSGLDNWYELRGQLLPSGISHKHWRQLNFTFRTLVELKPVVSTPNHPFGEKTLAAITEARDDCKDAVALLDPYAVEGDVPLLAPQRIFKGR